MQFLDLPVWRSAIRGLMAVLCNLIYSVMSFFYDLFNNISQINILSTSDVQPIYQRLTMILTIVMVFYITFQFVKYIVQPDSMTDKEKGAGNIIYKMIIVVALIAFVPKIFEMAYDLQNAIISKNVISKVILGPQAMTNEENLGAAFSASILNMFYNVDEENANKNCHDGATCSQLVNKNISSLKTEGNLSTISVGINMTDKKSDNPLINFEFDGLLPVIVGGFIVYILILYCIDVGVRWVQLIYLQLIAPIPILGYLTPKKDGIFQKWTKQCVTTYLDLFIRVAIINVILLLCDTLLKSKISGELIPEGATGMMATLIYVILIMAVMLFAHKAPKMIAELFPKQGVAAGNLGLSAKDRGLKGATRVFGAAAGATVGAGVGLATGLGHGLRRMKKLDKNAAWYQKAGAGIFGAAKGAVGGTVGGAVRGLANGSKKGNVIKNVSAGAKNQVKANQRFGNREESGYSFMHQMEDRTRGAIGAKSRVQVLEEEKAPIKRQNDMVSKIKGTEKSIKERALDKINNAGAGGIKAKEYLTKKRELEELKTSDKKVQEYIAKAAAAGTVMTEDEAKKKIGEDIKTLTNQVDDLEGKAVQEYVQTLTADGKVSDGAIESMIKQLEAELKYYNENNSQSRQINIDAILENMRSDYKLFTDVVKKGKVQDIENENKLKMAELDANIEAVKRETEGSGINEGKK